MIIKLCIVSCEAGERVRGYFYFFPPNAPASSCPQLPPPRRGAANASRLINPKISTGELRVSFFRGFESMNVTVRVL